MKKPLLLLVACAGVLGAQAQSTCATAVPVTMGSTIVAGITGTEIPAPLCAANGAGATAGMWYTFVPALDTTYTISTVASGVDTRFHVYTGSCGALVCVGGDDDSGPNYTSVTNLDLLSGVSYTVAFDNRWSSSGFSFEIGYTTIVVPPPPPEGMVVFTNLGLVGVQGSTYGAVDMNGDHLDDVVSVGSSNINVLRQIPGGFAPYNYITTAADNVASWSMSAGDLDGNGYNDLQYGGGGGVTYMMANTDGSAYTEVSFPEYVFSQRGNMVDINNDGDLDAFMCHDVDANVYYLNDGTGNLVFHQGEFGTTCGNYGSVWIDYDSDGDIDCFVAKCGCDPVDILMRNNGDGTFTSMAATLGLADQHQSWSSAWGDYDNDGDMDVLIGSSSSNVHKLMKNNGDGTFTNVTIGSGFDSFPGQSIEWNCRDFNNDGWIDIIGGGAIHYNNHDWTFSHDDTAPGNGPMGDLNNDGFIDILGGTTAYINYGNDNNWLTVATVGTWSNRNGIGARVEVTSALGTQIREIRSGDGFHYMSSLNAHFGLGTDTEITQVVIHWPSGLVDVIDSPAINGVVTVVEGTFTGVTENSPSTSLGLFPNPVLDVLTVNGASDLRNNRVTVIDVTGKRVMEGALRNGQFDVSGLTPGVYVLSVLVDGTMVQHRFSKQ
ncbi:MAG: FG-GAP-like repeat-containing protein [Flavobacteriales bacterium]